MHEIKDIFRGLVETDPDFREKWAKQLATALEAVSSLEIEGETFEGAAVLYRGALALHYTFEGLAILPETRALVEPLFQLQIALANARRGTTGPLKLSDPETKAARGKAGRPMSAQRLHIAMCAALAVEILTRADPPMKLTAACRKVAEIFDKSGVRGARGGHLSHQTVSDWHTRSLDVASIEHAAVRMELRDVLALSADEAVAEVRAWAKEAFSSQNLIRV